MNVTELPTPAVLVDLDVLEANLDRMAAAVLAAGIALRPHAKTHKVAEVARLQLARGARGLTLAKPGEAEAFAAAGFDDLFLAYPVVGADKARRLLALSERVRLAVGVDSEAGARTLGPTFAAAGRRLDVLLEVDPGFHRVGVDPAQAVAVATRVAEVPGVVLRGVFSHAGQAYGGANPEAVAAVGRAEGETLAAVAAALRAAGFDVPTVSAGSTPGLRGVLRAGGVTECRPGNYAYHDLSQVSLGTCTLADCALTVLATVVSVPAPGRAVLDAGSKALSADPLRPAPGGHGLVAGTRSRLDRLSEEHGMIAVAEGDRFAVGDRVRVVPNHSCVVSNLFDRVHAVRGDRVDAVWPVIARGRVD